MQNNKQPTKPQPTSATLALSVRQPFCELILRGIKRDEFRSRSTCIRSRIWLYASLSRYRAAEEAAMADEFGIDMTALPRGVIVGSVEIWNCVGDVGDFAWRLRSPERLSEPRKPERQPMPTWFYPW